MKNLWIASCLILGLAGVSIAKNPERTDAERLYAEGTQFLAQGHPEDAYNRWRSALAIYRQIHDEEGIRKSLISQSRAYEQLGQYRDACQTIVTALEIDPDLLCNAQDLETGSLAGTLAKIKDPKKAEGLQSLAISLRHLGQFRRATQTLDFLLQDENLSLPARNAVELERANTERSEFQQRMNQDLLSREFSTKEEARLKGIALGKSAFNYYASLFTKEQADVQLAAQINWLMLYADLSHWIDASATGQVPDLLTLQSSQKPYLSGILSQLSVTNYDTLPQISSVYSRLKVADGLLRLLKAKAAPPKTWEMAMRQAQVANQGAERLNHPRGQSQAWGLIGQLHQQAADLNQAWTAFDTARAYALSVRAVDLAYQWESALAQISQTTKPEQALRLYASAITHLESVRANLFTANQDEQIAFRESVAPLYQGYLALLINQPHPDLEQVLAVHEQYQVAELESYLQCGRLNYVPLSTIPAAIRPTTLHVLDLGQQIVVILRTPEGHLEWFTPNPKKIREIVNRLELSFADQRFWTFTQSTYLPDLQALYRELLVPVAGRLPEGGTLMFVVDSFMQNLPMSALHDGKGFLVERYSITNNISVQLRMPQPIRKTKTLLFAGLSEPNPNLRRPHIDPILDAELESALVRDEVQSSVNLLNDKFTWRHFQAEVRRKLPDIIHISTHGQFSSDPRQTYLLAWDQTVNLQAMQSFFQSSQVNPALLFLSACETAKGDHKAALGIAGMVVESGASSAIATLWLVESQSSIKLAQYFYQALGAGHSRAEALQLAQLQLLHSSEFNHPYFWSGYLLIGSWL